MSLVDLFFNSDYRESLNDRRKVLTTKVPEVPEVVESEEVIHRRKAKFLRDYHLKTMRNEVTLLNREILYRPDLLTLITEETFTKFLKSRSAKDWTIRLLWKEFKGLHSDVMSNRL